MLPIVLTLVAAGVTTFAYAALVERNWFAVRRHRIACLPPGSPPLRILHVSDLHLRPGQRRKRAFLASLASLRPDLTIGTGDFLGDEHAEDAVVEALAALCGRRGSLFVLGSNDYYLPRPINPFRYLRKHRAHTPRRGLENSVWPEMVRRLEAAGWRLVHNARTEVDGIEVVGFDDPHIGRADLSVATPRTDDRFRLAVAHSPDPAPELARLGYDLIVCGHTHGGQLRVPGFGALVTNSKLPRSMARGVHPLGRSWLHVTAGLGTSMYAPVRFACRPEACVLDLVPRADTPDADADAGTAVQRSPSIRA